MAGSREFKYFLLGYVRLRFYIYISLSFFIGKFDFCDLVLFLAAVFEFVADVGRSLK